MDMCVHVCVCLSGMVVKLWFLMKWFVVCVCVLFCLLFIRCGEGSVLAERKGGHWVCARLIRKRWF